MRSSERKQNLNPFLKQYQKTRTNDSKRIYKIYRTGRNLFNEPPIIIE